MRTKNILSIQSHVAYGYVGNRAAVFPLQRLGHDVSVINTVQFSNHTGYGESTGEIFSAKHIRDIIRGMRRRNAFVNMHAILSGYLGDAELGHIILELVNELKQQNPDFIYCCDPVIGDVGRGIFVKPQVAEYFKSEGILKADIITPNQFELNYLTDIDTNNLQDILSACQKLRKLGPKIILVTSVTLPHVSHQVIEMLVNTSEGTWIIRTPRLAFDIPPNGAGDATAAIFLAKYLDAKNILTALEHTTAAIFAIFKNTFHAKTRELQIIQTQDELVKPQERFKAEQIA